MCGIVHPKYPSHAHVFKWLQVIQDIHVRGFNIVVTVNPKIIVYRLNYVYF